MRSLLLLQIQRFIKKLCCELAPSSDYTINSLKKISKVSTLSTLLVKATDVFECWIIIAQSKIEKLYLKEIQLFYKKW